MLSPLHCSCPPLHLQLQPRIPAADGASGEHLQCCVPPARPALLSHTALAVPAPCPPRIPSSQPRLDAVPVPRWLLSAVTGSGTCRAATAAPGLQVWGHSNAGSIPSGQNSPCAKLCGFLGHPMPSPAQEAGGRLRCSPQKDGGAARSLLSRRSPSRFYQRYHPIFPGCFVFALHLSILPADPPVPLRGFINIAL